MTHILTISPSKTLARSARLLLVGASGLALSAPLAANQLLFTTSEARPVTGQRTDQRAGLTQVALTGGGTVSIVDAAEYRLNPDGSIDLYEGTITVASGAAGEVVVRMPEGLEGRVSGIGASGNFSVRDDGEASGHALTGSVQIGRADRFDSFAAGEMWRARGQSGARRVIANAAQVQPNIGGGGEAEALLVAQPNSVVAIGGDAGPVAAAVNGIPTGFGDQLAGAGASGDIVAAARRIEAVVGNPGLDTFPSSDLALLVAAAARIETLNGGTPFPEAQADIIRAYLRFLAGSGAGDGFLAAYSGFVVSYLDLIRAGGLPSGFATAGPEDVEAYLAYIRRTGALTNLASRDRVLAEAYLSFLASGGSRDAFARSFTDLTIAYFTFVRGGGDPAAFTGASQAALAQTIAFLRDSGLVVQLNATDRALVEAFLANGGLAFAAQYQAALGDYFAFLASGRRPSDYAALDQATLRAYLETLSNTGLLQRVLGDQARFYADYLAFLRGGGQIDAFAGLPANIFAGYTVQLDAYFAFLATGRRPSEFSGTDIAVLQNYLLELQRAGALERFLGDRAAFFAQFAAFVAAGGSFDAFGGLPANIFAGYAVQLNAYFAFLSGGRLPSEFSGTDIALLQAWLLELQGAGALERFLGDRAAFFAQFAAFVAAGGNFDAFAGLPANIFAGYAVQLDAYFAFLSSGRLPSEFSGTDLAVLQAWLLELQAAGALERFLGERASFFAAFAAFVAGGGSFDAFAGLPANVFAGYATDLRAFFAFIEAGGLPSAYTLLTAEQIRAYIAALEAAGATGSFLGDLAAFYREYAIYLAGGGNPDLFGGLPVPPDFPAFAAALNAYAAFLQAGGLPSAYTAEDLARLRSFIDALSRSGQLASLLGANADLLTRYFAFIAGGGAPDGFVGLPIYVEYIAALNAYYAFLQGGGLPSGYAALDAATIEAYLAALAALQGGLAAIEGLDPFFVDYFIYIAGGGDPDLFAGLPGNGGGGGGNPTDPNVPPVLTGYTGGFDAIGPRINIILGGQRNGDAFVGSETSFSASAYTLDSDGGLATYTRDPGGQVRNRGAAQQTDIFGNADAVIGRWTNGTISLPNTFTFNENQGLHYLLTRPIAPGFVPTLTGRVDYYLIGATRPTIANGSLAPGVFDAGMAIFLSGDYRLAMDGSITMPNGNNPYIYRFATTGGLEDPSQSDVTIGFNTIGAFFASIRATDNAGNCNANPDLCVFNLRGSFAGDEDTIGITYDARNGTTATAMVGAAIFEAGPTRTFGGGGSGGGGGGSTPTTRTNQNLAFANLTIGDDAVSGGSVTVDGQGRIVAYQSRDREVFAQGTTQIVESGVAAGVTWTRWANGTPAGDYYGTTVFAPVGPNGGWHVIAGEALSNIPTSGTIGYNLVGSTTPTRTGEGTSSGSITGSAAVQFGSTARFGLDLTVTSGSDQIRMATDGGVSDVSRSRLVINPAGVFSSGASNPEVTTTNLAGSFCASGCLSFVQGFLSGDGASGAGLSYAIRQQSVTPQGFINGTAAFERGNAIGGGNNGGRLTTYTGGFPANTGRAYATDSGNSQPGSEAAVVGTNGALQTAGDLRAGTAPAVEVAGDERAVLGRFSGGTATFRNGTNTYSANDGLPYVVLAPTVGSLPASGTIDYRVLAATSPVFTTGETPPGTFDGALSIRFGSQLQYRTAGTITMPETAGPVTYNFASTGYDQGTFQNVIIAGPGPNDLFLQANVTGTGRGCAGQGCNMSFYGGFGGQNPQERLGLVYQIFPGNFSLPRIQGAVIYAPVGTTTPAAASPVISTAGMATARTGVPVPATATAAPALPAADWSRWSGGVPPAGRLPEGGGNASGIGIVPPGLVGVEGVADPADRSAVIRQAEQLMGGMITFGRPAPEAR